MKPTDVLMYPNVEISAEGKANALADGQFICASNFCRKKFSSDAKCAEHYKNLSALSQPAWLQCPFGYSSYAFKFDGQLRSITGLIPFPRMGGDVERERAKDNPDQKIAKDGVEKNVSALQAIIFNLKNQVSTEITRSLAALHEVRKYNRNLKQTLERFCNRTSPQDPDQAQADIVKAWKISEFMSYQFDVLSLIADENLTQLAPKTESEIYKVFDKCVRLFTYFATERKMRISIKGDSPKAIVSDKTFPIMATVLIDSAIKYGAPGGSVDVEIKVFDVNRFRVTVGNDVESVSAIPVDPFQRGVRGSQDTDGSGVGLFLAQLVAKQHGTQIKCQRTKTGGQKDRVEFEFHMSSID